MKLSERHASFTRCTTAFAIMVLFASCTGMPDADPRSFERAPLFGMVYDQENQPVAGVNFSIDGREGLLSDITGRFVIPDLSRGEHTLVARKVDYELLMTVIQFSNQTQVVYIRMISRTELVQAAEDEVAARRFADAQSLIDRILTISPDDPEGSFLQAVLFHRSRRSLEAAAILEALIASGVTEEPVCLFLADLYEKALGDPGRAVKLLEGCVARSPTPRTRSKLDRLTNSVNAVGIDRVRPR
ncbi:MAG TPA: carboxypeptidase-like regulatory domain-containing protein [Spirochaetia bacterium]|nr:carboxypeptidase-like regulatory domain-containing protein [Spirochaetia bacterium]